MSGIFISYRRDDARAWAINLRDHLTREFGEKQIFLDVDSIDSGDWRTQIDRALDGCRVVLVLVGPRWLTAADQSGHTRLSQPDDVHRAEIAAALSRPDLAVIPILVDGAQLPPSSMLPDDIKGLVDRQAREIGDARDRRVAELRRLTRTLEELTGRRRLLRRAAAALVVILVAALVNSVVATGSTVAALMFLTLAAGIALTSWLTYRSMAREHMKGTWVALAAVILSSAMVAGSLMRLAAW